MPSIPMEADPWPLASYFLSPAIRRPLHLLLTFTSVPVPGLPLVPQKPPELPDVYNYICLQAMPNFTSTVYHTLLGHPQH